MQYRLECLNRWLQELQNHFRFNLDSMRKASADASFRCYYRLDGEDRSYIVMDCPPDKENVSAFIHVDQLFRAAGVNVPIIYAENEEEGFLLLSDLGTETYLDVLNEDNCDALMSEAIDALIKIQLASEPNILPDYSSEKLLQELELFPEWYIKRHLGLEISFKERKMLDQTFNLIVKKNLSQGKVYVHRDFMPRNLMISRENNPAVIDFQDALFGPISYDIASLCRDAFISWHESKVLDWTIRYWEKAKKANLPVREDFSQFWEDVEWMGLQRHLKVLGIFARINYRDGKSKYLSDTPRFMNYVKATARRYGALAPLAGYLERITGETKSEGYTF